MEKYWKNNMSMWISLFLLISPFLDLLTGINIHYYQTKLTIGIFTRMFFLLWIIIMTIFVFKKKKVLIPYSIIALYIFLYLLGMIVNKDGEVLFTEIQGIVKVFYFPILLISLYSIREEIRISKLTLFTSLFFYLLLLFVPLVLGIGYKTYEIAKEGTLGFYNSANEISAIISILTPFLMIILVHSKSIIPKICLGIMYLTVILMIGTKTPLLVLLITVVTSILYLWIKYLKEGKYKNIFAQLFIVAIGIMALSVIIPKTNFYKNIRIHLNYLELNHVTDVFKKKKYIDHFIFSERLSFLEKKNELYNQSNLYEKVFGLGYSMDDKVNKAVEIDYFDIFYNHGIVGFLLFFTPLFYLTYKLLKEKKEKTYEQCMLNLSLILIFLLSFFTGHILIAPSVSLLVVIILLSYTKYKKKSLLFTGYTMDLGGIEKALLNLVNRLDSEKYKVTIILEKKQGMFLERIKDTVIVQELKVSEDKNVFIRKIINASRKVIFKIFNYHNYDFSCCYTTYSYSGSKLALMSSNNTAFFIHSNYQNIYSKEDYYEFFNSRQIGEYKHIIFVSKEAQLAFIKNYPDLKEKCFVFNNFINISEILIKRREEIPEKKAENKKLFVYVGRLEDASKKIKRAINLAKNLDEIELWIIGDGPDRLMYEEYAKDIKNVRFLGKKDNPYSYMNQADYIILTSDYEGFPVVYLESLVLHKPIITTIPISDDSIEIKDYAYIISKDEKEMLKEVKEILKEKPVVKTVSLEEIQNDRIKRLERIFDNEEGEENA